MSISSVASNENNLNNTKTAKASKTYKTKVACRRRPISSLNFQFSIGDRISLPKSGWINCGTVRYRGRLKAVKKNPTNKIYLGIELDLPNGLNNGSVGDLQLFDCAANCGIFVPHKNVRLFVTSRVTALNHNQAMQTLHNGENARRRKHQQYPRGRLEAIAGLKAVKEATAVEKAKRIEAECAKEDARWDDYAQRKRLEKIARERKAMKEARLEREQQYRRERLEAIAGLQAVKEAKAVEEAERIEAGRVAAMELAAMELAAIKLQAIYRGRKLRMGFNEIKIQRLMEIIKRKRLKAMSMLKQFLRIPLAKVRVKLLKKQRAIMRALPKIHKFFRNKVLLLAKIKQLRAAQILHRFFSPFLFKRRLRVIRHANLIKEREWIIARVKNVSNLDVDNMSGALAVSFTSLIDNSNSMLDRAQQSFAPFKRAIKRRTTIIGSLLMELIACWGNKIPAERYLLTPFEKQAKILADIGTKPAIGIFADAYLSKHAFVLETLESCVENWIDKWNTNGYAMQCNICCEFIPNSEMGSSYTCNENTRTYNSLTPLMLLNAQVSIQWCRKIYTGVVDKFDSERGMHRVTYSDGDTRWYQISLQKPLKITSVSMHTRTTDFYVFNSKCKGSQVCIDKWCNKNIAETISETKTDNDNTTIDCCNNTCRCCLLQYFKLDMEGLSNNDTKWEGILCFCGDEHVIPEDGLVKDLFQKENKEEEYNVLVRKLRHRRISSSPGLRFCPNDECGTKKKIPVANPKCSRGHSMGVVEHW